MADPEAELRALSGARRRVALWLTATMVVIYFGFLGLIAWQKPLLGTLVRPGLSLGILLGGVLRHNALSVVGHFAEEMLVQLTADKLFLAADGCTLEYGISTSKFEESRINQAMVGIAREKYLVADSSKFGSNSLSRIVSLWEVDGVVTDEKLSDEYRDAIKTAGLKLVLVK